MYVGACVCACACVCTCESMCGEDLTRYHPQLQVLVCWWVLVCVCVREREREYVCGYVL